MRMASGQVKWFSPTKGYGFITPDGGGGEVFVHYTGLADARARNLRKGDCVSFDVVEGEKGPKALNVTREDPEES